MSSNDIDSLFAYIGILLGKKLIMRNLSELLLEREDTPSPSPALSWPLESDCHLHVVDGANPPLEPGALSVCFADCLLKQPGLYKGDKLIDIYKDFIKDHGKDIRKGRIVLLATGLDADSIKGLWNAFPKGMFRGIGELKCYDKYGTVKEIEVPYKKIQWVRDLCKFSGERCGCAPIYLHYTLNHPSYVKRLRRLLEDFPGIPIVLCHCGLSRRDQENTIYDMDWTFSQVRDLARDHGNLWLDVSHDAGDYVTWTPGRLESLPRDRVLLGSDCSPIASAMGAEGGWRWAPEAAKIIPYSQNLKKLFGLE